MNDDQLYYFLVDKNTRNVLQIEYPSDIDEFNKILGTSEGKGSLLKDLGIILNSDSVVFKNPELNTEQIKTIEDIKTKIAEVAKKVEFTPAPENVVVNVSIEAPKEKKVAKKSTPKKTKTESKPEPTKGSLFAGLFD